MSSRQSYLWTLFPLFYIPFLGGAGNRLVEEFLHVLPSFGAHALPLVLPQQSVINNRAPRRIPCLAPSRNPVVSTAPAAAIAQLTPTGKLRASINLGNPILAHKDPKTGQAMGVSVDLAQALAQQADSNVST